MICCPILCMFTWKLTGGDTQSIRARQGGLSVKVMPFLVTCLLSFCIDGLVWVSTNCPLRGSPSTLEIEPPEGGPVTA